MYHAVAFAVILVSSPSATRHHALLGAGAGMPQPHQASPAARNGHLEVPRDSLSLYWPLLEFAPPGSYSSPAQRTRS